jgi:hypothetical protein
MRVRNRDSHPAMRFSDAGLNFTVFRLVGFNVRMCGIGREL